MAIITLTTDFGTADAYVAAMKGVIWSVAPQVQIADISHDIRPQDLAHGAFVFRHAFEYFPPGAIHVVVVDPGVGTPRRLIAARAAGHFILAPDNGVLTLVAQDFLMNEVRAITRRDWFRPAPAATFHGRDILAPVAARLASGAPFDEIGPAIAEPLKSLSLPPPEVAPDGALVGCIIQIDRFGNLISNLRRWTIDDWSARRGIQTATVRLRTANAGDINVGTISHTYADANPGDPLALFGSNADALEIAIRDGSAAAHFKATVGAIIVLAPAT